MVFGICGFYIIRKTVLNVFISPLRANEHFSNAVAWVNFLPFLSTKKLLMPVNDSKFSPESGKRTSQIPTENISLDELESMHGGSESDQFQLLKKFGTKPGAYARLK